MSPFRCLTFDPCGELERRWPGWKIRLARLTGVTELIDGAARVVTIDPRQEDMEWAVAHATAHLDLQHHMVPLGGFLTDTQEADADALAHSRLFEEEDPFAHIPVDGPPTVQLG